MFSFKKYEKKTVNKKKIISQITAIQNKLRLLDQDQVFNVDYSVFLTKRQQQCLYGLNLCKIPKESLETTMFSPSNPNKIYNMLHKKIYWITYQKYRDHSKFISFVVISIVIYYPFLKKGTFLEDLSNLATPSKNLNQKIN